MRLIFFILNQEERIDEVLAAFIEAEIPGATILNTEGMGHVLTHEVPLFQTFQHFMKGSRPHNKTILSLVEDDAKIDRLVKLLEQIIGPLEEPGNGILFSVPVDRVFGLRREEN